MMRAHKLRCLCGMAMITMIRSSKIGGSEERITLCSDASILYPVPVGKGYKTERLTVKKLNFDMETQVFMDLENPDRDLNKEIGFQRPIIEVDTRSFLSIRDTTGKVFRIVLAAHDKLRIALWEKVLFDSSENITPTFYNAMWKDAFQIEKEMLGLTYEDCFQHLDVSTEKGIIFFAEEFQKVYRNGGKGNRELLPAASGGYIASKLQQALRTCVSTNCARAFQLLIGDLEKLNEVFGDELLEEEFRDELGSAHDLWLNYFALEIKKEVLDVFGQMSKGSFTYADFATKLAGGFLPGQILLLKDNVKDVGSRTKLVAELGESILTEYWAHVKNEVDHADLYRTLKEDVDTIIQGQIMADL